MAHFKEAPKPNNPLGYHRLLSPSAGIKVSPICLGTMSFGTRWSDFMGECTKEGAFEVLDTFYELGGNFIDTANMYQDEQSEEWLGEWLESRGVRDQMVIATKYTTGFRQHSVGKEIQSNFVGNSAKSLHHSLAASLKKLRTDYVDVLYVHWWDFTTPIEEVMQALNVQVNNGKVLYLAVSDTPAFIVSRANQYARDHGLRPFIAYQGRWSASFRDMESEIIPMCRMENMGICPWGVLGSGHIQTEDERAQREQDKTGRDLNRRPPRPVDIKVFKILEKIARAKGKTIQGIALAWVFHKVPYVFPVVGGRKAEHLRSNVEALTIKLSEEELGEIDDAGDFDPGFPMSFIFSAPRYRPDLTPSDVRLPKLVAWYDSVAPQSPIPPREFK